MATVENQDSWKCWGCLQVFDTKGKRDAYHRKIIQKFTVKRSGTAQIQRSRAGKFEYNCSNGYPRAQALKRYKQGCYASIAIMADMESSSDYKEGIIYRFERSMGSGSRTVAQHTICIMIILYSRSIHSWSTSSSSAVSKVDFMLWELAWSLLWIRMVTYLCYRKFFIFHVSRQVSRAVIKPSPSSPICCSAEPSLSGQDGPPSKLNRACKPPSWALADPPLGLLGLITGLPEVSCLSCNLCWPATL